MATILAYACLDVVIRYLMTLDSSSNVFIRGLGWNYEKHLWIVDREGSGRKLTRFWWRLWWCRAESAFGRVWRRSVLC